MPTERIEPGASAPKREPVDVQRLREPLTNDQCRVGLAACLDLIEDLLKDKARLDWLEDAGFPLVLDCWGSHPQFEVRQGVRDFNGKVLGAHNSIREAIDAALRGEPKEGM